MADSNTRLSSTSPTQTEVESDWRQSFEEESNLATKRLHDELAEHLSDLNPEIPFSAPEEVIRAKRSYLSKVNASLLKHEKDTKHCTESFIVKRFNENHSKRGLGSVATFEDVGIVSYNEWRNTALQFKEKELENRQKLYEIEYNKVHSNCVVEVYTEGEPLSGTEFTAVLIDAGTNNNEEIDSLGRASMPERPRKFLYPQDLLI